MLCKWKSSWHHHQLKLPLKSGILDSYIIIFDISAKYINIDVQERLTVIQIDNGVYEERLELYINIHCELFYCLSYKD